MMKNRNYNQCIPLPVKIFLVICSILAVTVLFKITGISAHVPDKTPTVNGVTPMAKTESSEETVYTFDETIIAKADFTLSTTRIVKFSFSEVLYITTSYGNYIPLLNEDGTPMTLTQFEEVINRGGNQE